MTHPVGHIAGAVSSVGHGIGAALGGALAATGAAGATALISYIIAKTKLYKQKKAFRNIDLDKKRLVKWQQALIDRAARMHLDKIDSAITLDYDIGEEGAVVSSGGGGSKATDIGSMQTTFTQGFIDAVGLQGRDGVNPTISPLCLDIYNDFANKAIQGDFVGLSGPILSLYEAVMFGVIDYLSQHGALVWNGDTESFSLKGGQLKQGCAAMLMFGNELSVLILRLSQVANTVTTNPKAEKAKQTKATQLVRAIHLSVEDAYQVHPDDPQKNGLLRVHASGTGRVLKKAMRLFGFENGREVSLAFLRDDIADSKIVDKDGNRKASIIERLKDLQMREAAVKADQARASELVLSAYKASERSFKAAIIATQKGDSTGVGPGAPAQLYFEGSVARDTVLHKVRTQTPLEQNRSTWEYMRRPFDADHADIIRLPSGDPDFRAVGDVGNTRKIPGKKRSARTVDKADASRDMKLWADIAFLRKAIGQLTDAYREEVVQGRGAKSPMAVYFLQMIDDGLTHLQSLYQNLANSDFFTEMLNRSLHHYTQTHHLPLHALHTQVPIGLPHEMGATRVIDIASFYGTSDTQIANLEALTVMNASTMAGSLRKEAAWQMHMHAQVRDMLASVELDPKKTEDISDWELTGARSKAFTLMSSLMANASVDQSDDPGLNSLKTHMVGWASKHEAFAAHPRHITIKHIADRHGAITQAYRESIIYAQQLLEESNTVLQDLSQQAPALYRHLVSHINEHYADHPSIAMEVDSHQVLQLHLQKHTLVDALDYQHMIDSILAIGNKVKRELEPFLEHIVSKASAPSTRSKEREALLKQSVGLDAFVEVYKQNLTRLHAARQGIPVITLKQKAKLVDAKGQEFQVSARKMMARVDQLNILVDSLNEKSDKMADELAIAQGQLENERKLYTEQMGDVKKLVSSHPELFAEGGQLAKLKSALNVDDGQLTARFEAMSAKIEEFQAMALERYADLSKHYDQLVKGSMATVHAIAERSTVAVERIEAREHALSHVSAAEEQALNAELDDFFDALDPKYDGLQEDHKLAFAARMREKFAAAQEDQLEFLGAMKGEFTTNVTDAKAFLDSAEMHVQKYQESRLTHKRLVALSKGVTESKELLKETIAVQQDQIKSARAYAARLEEKLQQQTDALKVKVDSIIASLETRYAAYQRQDNMAVKATEGRSVSAVMGQLGRKANPETQVKQAFDKKQIAIQAQLDSLQKALTVLKITENDEGEVKFVEHGSEQRRKEKKKVKRTRAMNAMISAFAMAHVQRQRFLPQWAGLTATSKSLAALLLPESSYKKKGLIKMLNKHITFLEYAFRDACGERYKEPDSFKILNRRMAQLTGGGRHSLTPFKLAKIMKDMAILQYQILHNGEKPSFTGGWSPDFKWSDFGAQFHQPIVGDTVVQAIPIDDHEGTVAKSDDAEAAGKATIAELDGFDLEDDAAMKQRADLGGGGGGGGGFTPRF